MLLALLRYGTEATKTAVLDQIRDMQMLRSLICLADDVTNERWYPANVGPNLLLIMQDLCRSCAAGAALLRFGPCRVSPLHIGLYRLLPTSMEEDPAMVVIYDMMTIMLQVSLHIAQRALCGCKYDPLELGPDRFIRNSDARRVA